MGKVWKNGGEQDKFIQKLIKKGKLNKYTKPSMLKANYPNVFGDPNVIRNHLNIVKRFNGLYLDGQSDNEDDYVEAIKDKSDDETSNAACQVVAETSIASSSGFDNIVHQNYLCEIYKEPENQCEKLAFAIQLPNGANNVKIDLSDDGIMAIIKYQWAKSMFNMEILYQKQLATNQINIHHPKILCLKNCLEKYRQRIDAAPEATIKVTLPMKVLTVSQSWTKSGVKCEDGSQVLLANFTGYTKNYNTKLTDSAVIFE